MGFWPYVGAYPPCSGRPLTGTARLQEGILDFYSYALDYGIYNCRSSTSDPNSASIHSDGRAGDVGFPVTNGQPHFQGYALCAVLRDNAYDLGLQGIIWNQRRYDARTPWGRTYTGPNPHTDHVHWEQHPTLALGLTVATVDRIIRKEAMAFTAQEETILKIVATYGTILTTLAKGLNTPGPTTGRIGDGMSLIHVLETYRLVALNAGVSALDHQAMARILGQ